MRATEKEKLFPINTGSLWNVKMFTVRRINWKWISQQADVARGIFVFFFFGWRKEEKMKLNSVVFWCCVWRGMDNVRRLGKTQPTANQACVWWCTLPFSSFPYRAAFLWMRLIRSYRMFRKGDGNECWQRWAQLWHFIRFNLNLYSIELL